MPNMIRIGKTPETLQEISMFGRVYAERWLDGMFREDRAASKKLRRDCIAKKKGFLLGYDAADQVVVDRFDELFEYGLELILEVTHMETVKTYAVLMYPYEQERILAVWGGLWGGLAVEFQEV